MKGLIPIGLFAFFLLGCSRPAEPKSELSVSYVFQRADGAVSRGDRNLSSVTETADATSDLLTEIGEASGDLVLRIRLLEGGYTEIEAKLVQGKTEGPSRMFLVSEQKRLLVSETNFAADQRHGRVIAYFPGEGVMFEGMWDMGRRSGDWTLNYRYGGPAVVASLRDDRYHGRVQVFDAVGKVIADGIYEAGEPIDGSFIDDPWALGQSVADYADYFVTRRFQCMSGSRSNEEEVEILKNAKKAAQPGATDNPDDAQ